MDRNDNDQGVGFLALGAVVTLALLFMMWYVTAARASSPIRVGPIRVNLTYSTQEVKVHNLTTHPLRVRCRWDVTEFQTTYPDHETHRIRGGRSATYILAGIDATVTDLRCRVVR